ncbi:MULTISPECIES: aromatic alcohol reductase [unclassified Rhizobium]|nr:aromatic alcohol reductase [Rhizobium sp. VS19-DR129.2]
MGEDLAPHPVLILAKTVADGLGVAEDFVYGHLPALRYHACTFLRPSRKYASYPFTRTMRLARISKMNSSRTAYSQSILVIGAGELGMPVLRNLARKARHHADTTISVLLRAATVESTDTVKQRDVSEIRELGIEIVTGDILAASVSELAAIFARFDTVIGCAGFSAGRNTPMKLAKAALDANLKRYFPWQFGVDFDVIGRGSPQDLFDAQIDVRDLLRAQDKTDWVVISTGMFTSFLFEPVFGVVDLKKNVVNALGSLDTEVTLTTPDDIGALTAEVVFAQPTIRNEIVYLAGDTLTYGAVADTLQKVLGRPFAKAEWTVPDLLSELARDPDNHIRKYRAVFAEGKGVAWPKRNSFNERNGIDVMTAEEWISENLRS